MLSLSDPLSGWCRVISAVTNCGFVVWLCPATSVAPAVMQFLAVAGDVTVVAPRLLLTLAAPSFPAANTDTKSCAEAQLFTNESVETDRSFPDSASTARLCSKGLSKLL